MRDVFDQVWGFRVALGWRAKALTLGLLTLPLALMSASAETKGDRRASLDWLVTEVREPVRIHRGEDGKDVVLENGLVSRTWRMRPNAACTSYRDVRTDAELLRSIRPEAIVSIDGNAYDVGGLTGAAVHNFFDLAAVDQFTSKDDSFKFTKYSVSEPQARLPWKPRYGAPNVLWPTPGIQLTLEFHGPALTTDSGADLSQVKVSVHYEMYQGAPFMTKWVTISNGTEREIEVDSLVIEQLALAPDQSKRLFAEASYSFYGMAPVRWELQSDFTTDVAPLFHEIFYGDVLHYAPADFLDELGLGRASELIGRVEGGNRTLFSVRYPHGPAKRLKPGEQFESFIVFEIVHDSDDRERKGLARRQLYRRLAPWTQENPIFMHLRSSDSASIRRAVDQCAEVGFEMLILTFWSGFNILTDDPEELARYREDFEYAHRKGIKIGGYILFCSSASHGEAHDAIDPATGRPGSLFGPSLCLGTEYSNAYFEKIYRFIDATGMDVIETDGPYHGYPCAATNHAFHSGERDSYRVNWERQCEFYRGCIERGLYINSPDWYFLNGTHKSSMGYRENNWSLPRDIQIVVGRQNIYDGTIEKTPSMGWMLVPLVEYHGGGAAAVLEPLSEHLDAYEWHLAQNFGSGVMAAYRGPRLYDTEETKAVVKKWVSFYKEHRDILNSDIIHVQRPTGRDLDVMLHVNPRLKTKGLAMVYNPTGGRLRKDLTIPLYYAGLEGAATVREEANGAKRIQLDHQSRAVIAVDLAPKSFTWLTFEAAPEEDP